MNCHQMKNAVESDEHDDRDPGVQAQAEEVVRRVDPQQLLEEAPEAVVGDVEREEPGGRILKRRSIQSRIADADQVVDELVEEGRVERVVVEVLPAGRCCGSISRPHGRSVGLPKSSWLNQLPDAADPLREQQARARRRP